ncbi:uncharacterized protein VICG_00609, partial [Vittaforma corneae ATCC 50505]
VIVTLYFINYSITNNNLLCLFDCTLFPPFLVFLEVQNEGLRMRKYTTFKFPYILIEDVKGKFQPIYKEYIRETPIINLSSPVLCCPFSNARRSVKPMKKNQIKSGYCEVCYVKYEDYNTHIQCADHREYAEDDYNYRMIDIFIKEFLEQELYGVASYLNSPCERLESKYSNGQPIAYDSESELDSLIRVSRGSLGEFDEVVEFNIILDNINKHSQEYK